MAPLAGTVGVGRWALGNGFCLREGLRVRTEAGTESTPLPKAQRPTPKKGNAPAGAGAPDAAWGEGNPPARSTTVRSKLLRGECAGVRCLGPDPAGRPPVKASPVLPDRGLSSIVERRQSSPRSGPWISDRTPAADQAVRSGGVISGTSACDSSEPPSGRAQQHAYILILAHSQESCRNFVTFLQCLTTPSAGSRPACMGPVRHPVGCGKYGDRTGSSRAYPDA